MKETNLCKFPRDIRFIILAYLNLNEISKLSLVSKDYLKICKDENFWMRKLQRDYSDFPWKNYQYVSWLGLYKRVTLKHGLLYDFKTQTLVVSYLVKKVIVSAASRTYVIDENNNLRMMRYGGYGNYFDRYLENAFDLYEQMKKQRGGRDNEEDDEEENDDEDETEPVTNVILLKNVKDLVMDEQSGLLLTMNGNVYDIGDGKMRVPEEIEIQGIQGTREELIKIAENVKKIGTSKTYSYYITTDDELYVRKNGECFYERKKSVFEFIATVRAVYMDSEMFYYATLNNHCFANFAINPVLDFKNNTKQILVNDDVWYFITDNDILAFFDHKTDEFFNFTGKYDKLFTRSINEGETMVYLVSTDLSLYQLYRPENTITIKHVADNVLSVDGNYFIALPLSDNYTPNVEPMRQF